MIQPKPGDRLSEYLLEEQLGAGSFGQVWKAHHHIWKDTFVAVKIPTDSQYVRNLQREGLTVHGLRHPNIVRALGLDPYADVPYLIMEYVDGLSLRHVIEQHSSGLSVLAAQRITCGILHALEHAHGNGVIHRDIKPENILIAGAKTVPAEQFRVEHVKVTDFGLGYAGQITTASILQSGSLLSEDGRSISGTLAYMAPEQRDGGETDQRSDLYSVGIVLFEMVCGERPSGSDLPSHVRNGLPSWVDAVYSRLYTRHDRRLATATEALRMIDAAAIPPRIVAPPTARSPSAGSAVATHRRHCPSCGHPLENADNFCIMCGTQVVDEPRRCPRCGGYPSPDDRFCVFCGASLAAETG